MRCYLLYIPIQIIKYFANLSSLKPEDINNDEVFTYIMSKIKLLRFGCQTLVSIDMHVK